MAGVTERILEALGEERGIAAYGALESAHYLVVNTGSLGQGEKLTPEYFKEFVKAPPAGLDERIVEFVRSDIHPRLWRVALLRVVEDALPGLGEGQRKDLLDYLDTTRAARGFRSYAASVVGDETEEAPTARFFYGRGISRALASAERMVDVALGGEPQAPEGYRQVAEILLPAKGARLKDLVDECVSRGYGDGSGMELAAVAEGFPARVLDSSRRYSAVAETFPEVRQEDVHRALDDLAAAYFRPSAPAEPSAVEPEGEIRSSEREDLRSARPSAEPSTDAENKEAPAQ